MLHPQGTVAQRHSSAISGRFASPWRLTGMGRCTFRVYCFEPSSGESSGKNSASEALAAVHRLEAELLRLGKQAASFQLQLEEQAASFQLMLDEQEAQTEGLRGVLLRLAASKLLKIGTQIAKNYHGMGRRALAEAMGTPWQGPTLSAETVKFSSLSAKLAIQQLPLPWSAVATVLRVEPTTCNACLDALVTARNTRTHPPDVEAFTAEVDACLEDLKAFPELREISPVADTAAHLIETDRTLQLPFLQESLTRPMDMDTVPERRA